MSEDVDVGVKMLVTRRRVRVVEEEVTEVITNTNNTDTRRELKRYEKNRLETFPSWLCDSYKVNPQHLARAGFYCTESGGTECFSCGMWKYSSYWQEGHDPDAVHHKERPNCLFVNGLSDNVPISNEEQGVRHQTLSPDGEAPRKLPRRNKTEQFKHVKTEK